jgi:hypothetical protein
VSGKMDDGDAYPVATMDSLLADKVADSRVLTDVPANAVFTDTVYTAPSSRPVSYISGLQDVLDTKANLRRLLRYPLSSTRKWHIRVTRLTVC